MDSKTRENVARPLGQIPSGCFILTARDGDQATGMLASWVQQADFDPPAVTVAVRSGRPIEPLIETAGCFVRNAIGEDPAPMCKHFGKGGALGEPAFTGLQTREDPAGVVIEQCTSHLSCRVLQRAAAGEHLIYIAEVIGGEAHGDVKPYVHLRRNGFKY